MKTMFDNHGDRMEGMFRGLDNRMSSIEEVLVSSTARAQQRIRDLEATMRYDIARNNEKQEQRFGEEIKRIEMKMEAAVPPQRELQQLEERLKKLEVGEKAGQNPGKNQNDTESKGGWRPQAVILGEWPEGTSRDTIVAARRAWVETLPQTTRAALLEPFAPRPSGRIAKVTVQPWRAQEIGWQLQHRLQGEKRVMPPRDAAVERSPELGQAKRWTKSAEEMVKQKYPQLVIIEGTVWTPDNKEAARFNHRWKKWEMRMGWKSLGIDSDTFTAATTPRQ